MSLILRVFAPDKIFSRDREVFSRRYGAELQEPGGIVHVLNLATRKASPSIGFTRPLLMSS
jgi:hypothetical protein